MSATLPTAPPSPDPSAGGQTLDEALADWVPAFIAQHRSSTPTERRTRAAYCQAVVNAHAGDLTGPWPHLAGHTWYRYAELVALGALRPDGVHAAGRWWHAPADPTGRPGLLERITGVFGWATP